MGQSELRMLPTDNDISSYLYASEIKPYVVKQNNIVESCITEISAINVVNMYCNTLMKSKFVHLVPIWKLYKMENNVGVLFKVCFSGFYIYIYSSLLFSQHI